MLYFVFEMFSHDASIEKQIIIKSSSTHPPVSNQIIIKLSSNHHQLILLYQIKSSSNYHQIIINSSCIKSNHHQIILCCVSCLKCFHMLLVLRIKSSSAVSSSNHPQLIIILCSVFQDLFAFVEFAGVEAPARAMRQRRHFIGSHRVTVKQRIFRESTFRPHRYLTPPRRGPRGDRPTAAGGGDDPITHSEVTVALSGATSVSGFGFCKAFSSRCSTTGVTTVFVILSVGWCI